MRTLRDQANVQTWNPSIFPLGLLVVQLVVDLDEALQPRFIVDGSLEGAWKGGPSRRQGRAGGRAEPADGLPTSAFSGLFGSTFGS